MTLLLCGAPNCKGGGQSEAGLTKHRNTCPEWLDHQQKVIRARKEKAAAAPTAGQDALAAARAGRLSLKRPAPADLQARKRRSPGLRVEGPSRSHQAPPPSPEPESLFVPEYDGGGNSDDVVMRDVESTSTADTNGTSSAPPNTTTIDADTDDSAPGRPKRTIRLPTRFRDTPPEPLPPVDLAPLPEAPTSRLPRVVLIVRDTFTSFKNSFGLWREYPHRPTYDPDSLITLEHLSNRFRQPAVPNTPPQPREPVASTTNRSASHLLSWQNNGNTRKTAGELNTLVHDILRHPEFDIDELENFDATRANRQMDIEAQAEFPLLADFKETSVKIEVPSGSAAVPSRFFRCPRELYNSDVFIAEHDRIQRRGKVPDDDPHCTREKIIAALMWWSDSTHLANFGTAKLWPIYMLFGNLSKYLRAQPNVGAEHHIAYIPSLPDSIQDEISRFHAKWATQKGEILTHCRRELMHAVWKHLLSDPEFVHAYKYGIVIKCSDGVERRVYPRIFTYSADYPEKVLLATIRDGGICPCPRCLTPKSQLHLMGLVRDITARVSKARQYLADKIRTARRFIYQLGVAIGSTRVEDLLKETSSVPTVNAFIDQLGEDFDLHRMLVVDFMHEFELGGELDRRYRQMPRFGTSTIRRFATNASEMKKLGARDFEDLLQCAIPAFDGLFPAEHNARILKLLYRMAQWHACAKLRMHTDPTLEHLKKLTPKLATYELPRETAARGRREQRLAAAAAARASGSTPAAPTPTPLPVPAQAVPPKSKKEKTFNLNTYKWHAMGDYAPTIQLFGPSDSYSTQLGESLHRLVKRMYTVTNKRNHTAQIAARYMRLKRAKAAARMAKKHRHHVAYGDDDPLGATPLDIHHHTSRARRRPLDMYNDFDPESGDPAMVDFIPKLKDHVLGRLQKREFDGDTHEEFTPDDRNTVRIIGNRIYATRTLRVNYTTYDVRRGQDTLNPRTSCFAMVHSAETEAGAHPYWYCQILGIFHTTVCEVASNGEHTTPQSMEILWVRWMGVEPGFRAGIKMARLPKVGFVEESDPYAFGFLDPQHVIRGCHLIPDFAAGRTNDLLATQGPTAARSPDDTEDWRTYYVDIFVDRDMFMRYFGGGVGHTSIGTTDEDNDPTPMDDTAAGDDQPGSQDSDDSDSDSDSESETEEDLDEEDLDEEELGEEDLGDEGDEPLEEDIGFDDF
ncbi:hypothetical protein MSAN_00633200 [Mycena sanguinolenta]|uniref:Uncharacterized protein n=1 Tax=Mycena sanguinolenta TaxID=230812 RepID=A0A8H7DEG7_9AGAR|nr:hypothetical protein MSAN_00633200 [Mycena sanguinolenta]